MPPTKPKIVALSIIQSTSNYQRSLLVIKLKLIVIGSKIFCRLWAVKKLMGDKGQICFFPSARDEG